MILDTIAKSTRKRVDERKYAKPLKQVMREALCVRRGTGTEDICLRRRCPVPGFLLSVK